MKKAVLIFMFLLVGTVNASAKDFYVSPDAKPGGKGTLSSPFASLSEAQAAVRTIISNEVKQDITVYLRGGNYRLRETFVLGLQD